MSAEPPTPTGNQFHKKMAVSFFNETWRLLDKPDRTPAEDVRMIHLAHASRLHWEFLNTPENQALSEWQVSRVHAVLGQRDSALYHARHSLDIVHRNHLAPFYLACGHEAMAMAVALTDRQAALTRIIAAAQKIATDVADPEDEKIFCEDLSGINVQLKSSRLQKTST